MEINLAILAVLIGSAGVAGALATLILLPFSKRKIIAETNKLVAEAQGELQDQIFALVAQNKDLFQSMEAQRTRNEKLREELDRLHAGQAILREELETERRRNIHLLGELEMHRKNSTANMIRIGELEKDLNSAAYQAGQLRDEVLRLSKATGKLELASK